MFTVNVTNCKTTWYDIGRYAHDDRDDDGPTIF